MAHTFAEVILPLSLKGTFTYRVPENELSNIEIGKRVLIPFGGRKIYTGIVANLHNEAPQGYETKEIISILEQQPLLLPFHLQFWEWLSEYYLCSLGDVYRFAFPSSLKLESETYVRLRTEIEIDYEILDAHEMYLIQALEVRQLVNISEMEAFIPKKDIIRTVKSLLDLRYIVIDEKIAEKYKAKEIRYVRLKNREEISKNLPAWLSELKKAPRQKELLLYLIEHETENPDTPLRKSQIHQDLNATDAPLKALIDKEIAEEYLLQEDRILGYEGELETLEPLSEIQKKAKTEIDHAFAEGKNVLLYGVTSSGKTHLYAEKINETLHQGKQVLYMVPEIGLAKQIIQRLEKKYGKAVVSYHSKLTDFEKVEIWQKIIRGDAKIIVGTRASLFLPMKNIGLIVVDEEHDSAYRPKEVSPYFNAKDASIMLGHIIQCPVILGSATPSVETFSLTESGKMALVNLPERYQNVTLPEFEIEYLKESQESKKMIGNFSENTLENIAKTVQAGKQVMVLHNKRGYASVVECQTCGHVSYCSNCDVVMTYHKSTHELKCHYCGHRASKPIECPKCQSKNLNTKGIGVEQIHEELQKYFPEYTIDRMDIDSMRKKFAYERLYEKIENGQTQILVGTQMISKGLDFENIELVVIPKADGLFYIQDFRAEERAYQLITQLAGRAGRVSGKGKIKIQTMNPHHEIFHRLKNNEAPHLYHYFIEERKKFLYPPYTRLILLELKHRNEEKVRKASLYLSSLLHQAIPAQCILGPEKSPIPRLNLLYQYQILMKLPRGKNYIEFKKQIAKAIQDFHDIKAYQQVKCNIYVDF